MNRKLLIGCVLIALGCARDKDGKPTVSGTLPGLPSQPVPVSKNVLAGGQSNMTLMINDRDGTATYFIQALRHYDIEGTLALEAHGGSSQQDWTPGSPYYNSLIAKGRALSRVDVFIWWQGKAEGATMYPPLGQPQPIALAQAWGQNFTEFIAAVRRDLGQPDLPVIFCQIGPNLGGLDSWDEVRRQQAEVFIPHAYFVKTEGANFHGWFHTDDEGYQLIAHQIVSIFMQINAKES